MSNIKVKGKVFRDVEKMDLENLGKVRAALVEAMNGHVKEGLRLRAVARTPGVASTIARMDGEMQQWQKRLAHIDSLAKPLIKKETTEKLAADQQAFTQATGAAAASDAKLIVVGRSQGKSVPADVMLESPTPA